VVFNQTLHHISVFYFDKPGLQL